MNGKVFLDLRIKNTSGKIAFFTQVRLMDKEGAIVPATFYSDNFFSLLAGDERKITIEISKDRWTAAKRLTVAAFNTGETDLKF